MTWLICFSGMIPVPTDTTAAGRAQIMMARRAAVVQRETVAPTDAGPWHEDQIKIKWKNSSFKTVMFKNDTWHNYLFHMLSSGYWMLLVTCFDVIFLTHRQTCKDIATQCVDCVVSSLTLNGNRHQSAVLKRLTHIYSLSVERLKLPQIDWLPISGFCPCNSDREL